MSVPTAKQYFDPFKGWTYDKPKPGKPLIHGIQLPRPRPAQKPKFQALCVSGEFIPPRPRPKEDRVGCERIGHVVWYDKAKRYGMLRDAQTEDELFFHRSSLAGAANTSGLVGVKPGTCTAFTTGVDHKGRKCCDWVTMSPGMVNCKELKVLMVDQGGTEIRRPSSDEKLDQVLESMEVTDQPSSQVLKVELVLPNGDAIEFSDVKMRMGKGSNTYVIVGDGELVKGALPHLATSPLGKMDDGNRHGGEIEEDAVEAILRAPMTARQVISDAYTKIQHAKADEHDEEERAGEALGLFVVARGE